MTLGKAFKNLFVHCSGRHNCTYAFHIKVQLNNVHVYVFVLFWGFLVVTDVPEVLVFHISQKIFHHTTQSKPSVKRKENLDCKIFWVENIYGRDLNRSLEEQLWFIPNVHTVFVVISDHDFPVESYLCLLLKVIQSFYRVYIKGGQTRSSGDQSHICTIDGGTYDITVGREPRLRRPHAYTQAPTCEMPLRTRVTACMRSCDLISTSQCLSHCVATGHPCRCPIRASSVY